MRNAGAAVPCYPNVMASTSDMLLKGKPFGEGLDIRRYSFASESDLAEYRKTIGRELAAMDPDARLALIDIHRDRVAKRQAALKEHLELCAALNEKAQGFSSTAAYQRARTILSWQDWPATDYLDEQLLLEDIIAVYRELQQAR